MRAWLISVMIMAGCLHAQGPSTGKHASDPGKILKFKELVNEAVTIGLAAAFVHVHEMPREDWIGPAEQAYWSFMRMHAYVSAGEIAWRFKFDPAYVEKALNEAHIDAQSREAAYFADTGQNSDARRLDAEDALKKEAIIACRYSAELDAGVTAVVEAVAFRTRTGEDAVLYPLLDAGCPVDLQLRNNIIDSAVRDRMYDYAIRHALESDWDPIRTSMFIDEFFDFRRCTGGFRAVVAFKIPVEGVVKLIGGSNCETETLDSSGWTLTQDVARTYFAAAVEKHKYNLALEFLTFANLGEEEPSVVFQDAFKSGYQGDLADVILLHKEHYDAFMTYAFDAGRYRFVALYASTLEWERKGFDKLIELRQWDFAAEAAQYGCDATFRDEGILLALRAAMAAGDFKAGRYLLARYGPTASSAGILTQAMYDEEKSKYFAAKAATTPAAPVPPPRKHKKRKAPKCATDDWCVKGDQ